MSEPKIAMLDLCEQYLSLRAEIRRAIDAVCDAQAFVLGPTTESFEKNLAEYCGTRYALGVSSGTDALLCALMALDIKAGDEVICPAFTFFATAGVVARLGAKPVFADIDPRTFNLDPGTLEQRITPRTRAVIPVDLYGQCADYTAINAIAHRYNVAVVEDAAQAIGARQGAKKAAALSLLGCLSFYPTKNLGAFGDAGALCTDSQELYEKCQLLRVHGSGHRNTYQHQFIGGNFRLDALQAAVLNVKLKHLDQWHEGAGATPPCTISYWPAPRYARRWSPRATGAFTTNTSCAFPIGMPSNHIWRPRASARRFTTRRRCICRNALLTWAIGRVIFPTANWPAARCWRLPIYPELAPEQIRPWRRRFWRQSKSDNGAIPVCPNTQFISPGPCVDSYLA